jgi:hypothetical protein
MVPRVTDYDSFDCISVLFFQELMRSMRASNPRMREIQASMETEDVVR